MGYRSEVLLALKPDAQAVLSTIVARGGTIVDMLNEDTNEIDEWEDGSIIYSWSDIKWYDSYPEVAAIEELISRLEENDMDESYRFVRIGEDTDDNDVRGYGFEIGINRTIEHW
jgi:hypothetical protein